MTHFSSLHHTRIRAPLSRLLSQPATATATRTATRRRPKPFNTSSASWTELSSLSSPSSPSSPSTTTTTTTTTTTKSKIAQQQVHRQSRRWRSPSPNVTTTTNITTTNSRSTIRNQQQQQQQPNFLHAFSRSKILHHPKQQYPSSSSSSSSSIPKSNSKSKPFSTVENTRHRLLISYHDLERALERRGLRSVRVVLSAIFTMALSIGLAWPRIKQWGAVEGAQVAAASLEHENLQNKFNEIVHDVLNDSNTLIHVESLMKNAIKNLFNDPDFTNIAIEWTADVFQNALIRDSVINRGSDYVAHVFSKDESIDTAKIFLSESVKQIVNDETVQDTVASGLWSSIRASLMGRRKKKKDIHVNENENVISTNKTVSNHNDRNESGNVSHNVESNNVTVRASASVESTEENTSSTIKNSNATIENDKTSSSTSEKK